MGYFKKPKIIAIAAVNVFVLSFAGAADAQNPPPSLFNQWFLNGGVY